ncbi:MAG: hypothetical protein IAG13_25410 [Deltaproteobacteria bacterium]|nr:hypothetical protein [Nannocystaceae bacterium]
MDEREIQLRITVVSPPADVAFAMQRGRDELHQATRSTGEDISFDFAVRVRSGTVAGLNFLGPYTQGPPSVRFVYVNMGTAAGDTRSPWARRAKVPLMGITGITEALVERLGKSPGARLEARYAGTAKDGSPSCASVKLLGDGWTLVAG